MEKSQDVGAGSSSALHVVCPHCDTVNRVPQARLAGGGKCGKCHQPLFTGHPVNLTTARFASQIGRSDLPVLVDFWARWCGPCQMMAPAFEQAARDLEPTVRLAKVDTDAETQLARTHGIRSIPTMILFAGGREVARVSGALTASNIRNWVSQHLQ